MFLDGRYLRKGAGEIEMLQCKVQNPVHLCAVSDGMGGWSHGDVAALLAMRTLEAHYYAGFSDARFYDYIDAVNNRVCTESQKRNYRMGATVALLYLTEDQAAICNVGDSRIYLFYRGKLIQLSEDHRRYVRGINRTVLTQHLGVLPEDYLLEPYVKRHIRLESGMRFLLCSDGVTDMLPDKALSDILSESAEYSPSNVVSTLIRTALREGGRDNATAVVVDVK
jgi:protein phosphatase